MNKTIIALGVIATLGFTGCGVAPRVVTDTNAAPSDCSDVSTDGTSSLIPTDWDSWCIGYRAAETQVGDHTSASAATLCRDFWDLPDSDIIDIAMDDYGLNRSAAIGMVDYFWLFCG